MGGARFRAGRSRAYDKTRTGRLFLASWGGRAAGNGQGLPADLKALFVRASVRAWTGTCADSV